METKELVQTLLEGLEGVPDPRSAQGRRHPLGAILALSVAAMLGGARSLYGIWQWGREQDEEVVRALGFTRQQTPGVATLHRVFARLDVEAFERVVGEWAARQLGGGQAVIAIDGKGLRGQHGEELPGVRLVAAYVDAAGVVLRQKGGEGGGRGVRGGGKAT